MVSEPRKVIMKPMSQTFPSQMSLRATALTQSPGALPRGRELFCIDLDWRGPDVKVLMGESGVGKSTLLKTLGGVWKPRSGSLWINDESLWHRENSFSQNKELLKKIGFCFQNNALFNSMNCLENLLFPHRKRHPEIAEEERITLARRWLERVELRHVESLLPHELSGGMQKRLAIARTLMLSPEIVFFDDPTAGLDPITSRQIASTLKELLKEAPALSVVVTNDEDRARQLSDHYFLLEEATLTQRELSP